MNPSADPWSQPIVSTDSRWEAAMKLLWPVASDVNQITNTRVAKGRQKQYKSPATFNNPAFRNNACTLQCNTCIFVKKNRQRCKNTVCIGLPYCHVHLAQLGLKKKPSVIAGAGLGLFAVKTFRKGRTIMRYYGDLVPYTEHNDKFYDQPGAGNYAYQVGKRSFIDSKCQRSAAALINEKRAWRQNNCKFVSDVQRQSVRIVATRNINGTNTEPVELYVWYGADYARDY